MATETPAEKLARLEAAEAARLAEEEKKKRAAAEQQQLSMLGRMWDTVTDFFGGFWGLLAVAIIGFIAVKAVGWDKMKEYFGQAVDWVKEAAAPLIDMLPASIKAMFGNAEEYLTEMANKDMNELRKTLEEKGVPAPVLGVIADKKETFLQFMSDVRTANEVKDAAGKVITKGTVSADTMTNDKTIFALMRDRPAQVRALIAALPKEEAGKETKTTKNVKEAMVGIINSDKLDVLLSAKHFDETMKTLQAAAAKVGSIVPPETLRQLVIDGLDPTSGKPTVKLRTMLSAAMAGDVAKAMALGMEGKSATQALAMVDPNTLTPEAKEALKAVNAAIKDNAAAQAALNTLAEQMGGTAKFAQLASALSAQGPNALRALMTPENIKLLPAIHAFVREVPEFAKQVPFKLDSLHTLIQATGMNAQGQPNAALTTLLGTLSKQQTLSMDALAKPLQDYVLSPEVAQNPLALDAVKTFVTGLDKNALSPSANASLALLPQLTPTALVSFSNLKVAGIADPFAFVDRLLKGTDGKQTFTPARALEVLKDPGLRAALTRKDVAENIAALAHEFSLATRGLGLTGKNIEVIAMFRGKVETNTASGPNSRNYQRHDEKVMAALTAMVMGEKDPLKNLNASEVVGFFSTPGNPGNADAIRALLLDIDTTVMPPKQQQLIETLRANFVTQNGGLLKILTSEKDVQILLDQARNAQAPQSCSVAAQNYKAPLSLGFIGGIVDTLGSTGTMSNNAAELNAIHRALAKANCTGDAWAAVGAPMPTPPRNGTSGIAPYVAP